MRQALLRGVDYVDTAPWYGRSEVVLGKVSMHVESSLSRHSDVIGQSTFLEHLLEHQKGLLEHTHAIRFYSYHGEHYVKIRVLTC